MCTSQTKCQVLHQKKEELEDVALSGIITGKPDSGAQCFAFINNFKHLYKNPGKVWKAVQCP